MTTGETEALKVTTSTGVVFELNAPAVWAVNDLHRQLEDTRPKPPKIWLKDKEREEENLADPDYLAAQGAFDLGLVQRMYDISISTGTKVLESPVEDHNSDDFKDLLGVLGFEMPDSPRVRYLKWVKYMAAPTPEDMAMLLTPLLRMLGTTEEDVVTATQTFQGPTQRPATDGSGAQRPNRDRTKLRTTSP